MNKEINNKFSYKEKDYFNILSILFNFILNIVIIIISLYIKPMQFENWLLPFTLLSLIQLSINLIIIIRLEKSLFSLTTLFLVFSYITHLGILVIFGFRVDIVLPWNPLISITEDAFKEACYFTVLCHSFLTLGMCIVLRKRRTSALYIQKTNVIHSEINELYIVRRIGTILILIGILPMLYIDINRFILYINGGYLSTYELGLHGFVYTISRMTEIGLMMLLIANYKNKKKVYCILSIIMLYQSIIMFTGNRGRPVMYLITIFFIYYNFIQKIKFKQLVKVPILLYFAGFLLTFVGSYRHMAINNINTLIDLAKKSFVEFSPLKILPEFGITIITLAHSLELFPNTRTFQFGTNYIASFLTIFPNIGGILNPILNKVIYVYSWPLYVRQSLGGSYLGELYYSFGDCSFIFAIFIGMLIAYVSNQMHKNIIRQNYVLLSVYLMLFPNILWWIRNYFGDMVREFVWISLSILILYRIFSKRILKTFKDKG